MPIQIAECDDLPDTYACIRDIAVPDSVSSESYIEHQLVPVLKSYISDQQEDHNFIKGQKVSSLTY